MQPMHTTVLRSSNSTVCPNSYMNSWLAPQEYGVLLSEVSLCVRMMVECKALEELTNKEMEIMQTHKQRGQS